MKVFTARVVTDSLDTYVFVYKNKPASKDVVYKVYELERAEEYDWYLETTAVYIEETELIE